MGNDLKCPECGSRKCTQKIDYSCLYKPIENIVCDKCFYIGDITDFYKPKLTIIAKKIY